MLDDNVGSYYQYFLSWGVVFASPSINWSVVETLQGVEGDNFKAFVHDGDGSALVLLSTGNQGLSTAWQHILIVRSGTTLTQYIDGSADGTATDANHDATDVAAVMYIGIREDFQVDRRLGGSMAEWAKWDRALDASERAALVAGYAPPFFNPEWYIPMVRTYQELNNALTITNNSSTVAAHPPIIYPSALISGFGTEAAAPPASIVVLRRRRS